MEEFGVTICILFAGGFALFMALLGHGYGSLFLSGRKLRRELAASGRVISLREAKKFVARGYETVLVEAPTLGWGVYRIWWTAEPVITGNSDPENMEKLCSEADERNYDTLIDSVTGVAKVVRPFVFHFMVAPFLSYHFGAKTFACVFSGLVAWQRTVAEFEARNERGTPGWKSEVRMLL